jgi:predicted permease
MALQTLDAVHQDVRYALRGMRRNPVFTLVAVACLALGIGANTAIFSLFNAVMLRSLPVSHPERLVFFQHTYERAGVGALRRISSGYSRASLPYATFEAFRDRARTLTGVFVFASAGTEGNGLTVDVSGRPVTADGEMVTGGYFSVLGVSPILGRAIVDGDLNPGSPNVAVVSQKFWQRELGGERSAVGRSIAVNGLPFTIVGVAPPGFAGVQGAVPDLWLPLRPGPALKPWGSQSASTGSIFTDRGYWWCAVAGRVRPGVTRSQVQAETEHLFLQSITAGTSEISPKLPALTVSNASPAFDALRRRFTAPLRILIATAALVLLIACANIATLLVARAKSRQKEIGVRLAIGASRGRVVRQLLTESVLLSLCGGMLGLLFAQWGGPALLRLIVGERQVTPLNLTPDATVLAFAAAVSVATGVLFGLTPAFRAARKDLAPQLTEAAASTTPRRGLVRVLVASQIALSVVLLFGAGLFARTFRNLDGQTLGFAPENLLLFEVDPERGGYTGATGIALHGRLLDRIQALPGVRSASFSQAALLSGDHNTSPSATDGGLPPRQNEVHYNRVGPRFFETMGMRVLLGRGIGPRDTDAGRPTAVVNQSWARSYLPNENPVGHRVSIGGEAFQPQRAYEIVGVAEDAKYDQMRNAPPRTVYVSYGTKWDRARRMCFAVRAAADPLALTASVREAIRDVDAHLPLFNVRTQRQQIDEALGQERMLAHLSSLFGGLALLLVAIGVYGTLSYAVTQRTREIGLRMALGARRVDVVWMILRESVIVAAFGLAAGVPVALALSRLAASTLFGVSTHDGATLAATVVLLSAIAAVSGFLPANRASRIDPLQALRHE